MKKKKTLIEDKQENYHYQKREKIILKLIPVLFAQNIKERIDILMTITTMNIIRCNHHIIITVLLI